VDEHEAALADEALDPARAALWLLAGREGPGHRGGRVRLTGVVQQPRGAAGEHSREAVAVGDAP
jgi:hypothetical protein